ncbi:MAG: hypothetical protein H7A30_08190 [Thermotogae bacterium]|nr:hypothetical protein [Thermotogota bacterium]
MYLYKNNNKKLNSVKEENFKLEKEIQIICENNLEDIFNLEFVKTEFSLQNFRIDTLAFNKETSSFVIIEYKKVKNYSVIDQGLSYLSLMLNNKSDFIIEYNESLSKSLKRSDVDWSQSLVIFISPQFSVFQKESINFKNLPIELWEIKKYENNLISFNKLSAHNPTETLETITKGSLNTKDKEVLQELKVYTENDHLKDKSEEIIELYEKIKEGVLNIDENINIKANKRYISFSKNNKIFLSVAVLISKLKLWINLKQGELDDGKHISKDVSSLGHLASGDYEINIFDAKNLEYILSLIKQGYNKYLN